MNFVGVERPRVALARSLAAFPDILLLDEPLASLDAPFRGVILQKLREIFSELHIPMLYVSHSISEVMALAHRVAVLSNGKVIATGKVGILLSDSNAKQVADFASFENLLQGTTGSVGSYGQKFISIGNIRLILPDGRSDKGETDEILVSIRASDIILTKVRPVGLSARNVVAARVKEIHPTDTSLLVECDIGDSIYVEITNHAQDELNIGPGTEVFLIIKASSIVVLDN